MTLEPFVIAAGGRKASRKVIIANATGSAMREYIVKGGKRLRRGYTTGSCATAAAAGAAQLLLGGNAIKKITITLPGEVNISLPLEQQEQSAGRAFCAVRKDAGDDPDVTDGIMICAECSLAPYGIEIAGGRGVGTVTGEGLPVPAGQAAINPAPREMIVKNLLEVCRRHGYTGGMRVVISVPEGEKLARRTFNPRLGVEGGISILGTTGMVEPMSEQAFTDTIKLLIDRRYLADPENILITPGNYGEVFCRDYLRLNPRLTVKCSNFLGETLDYLRYKGFKRMLLVGDAGKLVKLAGGIMNTHSKMADCRMEIIAAHAAMAGGSSRTVRAVMNAKTTMEAIDILKLQTLSAAVFQSLLEKIMLHLRYRLGEETRAGVIVFSQQEILMQSENAALFSTFFSGVKA